MTKFTCDNHKPFYGETHGEAGDHFALMKARRRYGRRGQVGACRVDCWNGEAVHFEAFIGYPVERNATAGGNVSFVVYGEKSK